MNNNLKSGVVQKFSLFNPTKKCGIKKIGAPPPFSLFNKSMIKTRRNINNKNNNRTASAMNINNKNNNRTAAAMNINNKNNNRTAAAMNTIYDKDIRSLIKDIVREPLKLQNVKQLDNPILSYKNHKNHKKKKRTKMNINSNSNSNSSNTKKIVVPNTAGSEVHIHIHTNKSDKKLCPKCKQCPRSKRGKK